MFGLRKMTGAVAGAADAVRETADEGKVSLTEVRELAKIIGALFALTLVVSLLTLAVVVARD